MTCTFMHEMKKNVLETIILQYSYLYVHVKHTFEETDIAH